MKESTLKQVIRMAISKGMIERINGSACGTKSCAMEAEWFNGHNEKKLCERCTNFYFSNGAKIGKEIMERWDELRKSHGEMAAYDIARKQIGLSQDKAWEYLSIAALEHEVTKKQIT